LGNVMKFVYIVLILIIVGANVHKLRDCGRGGQDSVELGSGEFLSETYKMDRLYKSMMGPASLQKVLLKRGPKSELLWITGIASTIVGADGEARAPQDFMCHTNVDFNVKRHMKIFGWSKSAHNRLFILSQGQNEVRFPPGFGIPIMSKERLRLSTQVLNHNEKDGVFTVRHRTKIDFIADKNLRGPMIPLYAKSVYSLALLPGQDPELVKSAPKGMEVRNRPTTSKKTFTGPNGLLYIGHWTVKPGRETLITPVSWILKLSSDTTVHAISTHLHPFAESLELVDVTAGRSVFKSRADNYSEKIGLSRVQGYSSEEGIPIYADHDYELISTYNNTTSEDQDSMAVMLLYLRDHEFRKPSR